MGKGHSAPAIMMTERQHRLLKEEAQRRTTLRQFCERIRVLLGCHSGIALKVLNKQLEVDLSFIKRWRSRWLSNYDALVKFEQGIDGKGVSDHDILAKMLEIISDHPRPGKPPSITLAQKQQLMALACEKPENYGLARTNWTHKTLAETAVEKGIFDRISPRYVGTILKKTN